MMCERVWGGGGVVGSPNSERDSMMPCVVQYSFYTGLYISEINHVDKKLIFTLQIGDLFFLNLDSGGRKVVRKKLVLRKLTCPFLN
jgi:hypothetical protein